jgi:ribose transport system substrate-binding protein
MGMRWAGLVIPAAVICVAACSNANSGHPAGDRIAFFGFAKANSFSTATFSGIRDYAKAHGSTAEFIDPNFDVQTQVRQIQDAVTAKRFGVFIVQANDGTAVVPAVRAAVRAGIKVVVDFTPLGNRYDTAQPQVGGTVTLVDVPTRNGSALGGLAVEACRSRRLSPCKVAYLEGLRALPLDNARTKAALGALRSAPGVTVKGDLEGGYTQQSGRKAMQDLLQRQPDIDVVIGSSQAIIGAEAVAKNKRILYIANGGSRQAVRAVQDGRWFAAYYLPVRTLGGKAAELGLDAARGKNVPTTTIMTDLAPGRGMGTRQALAGVRGEYDE